jgi:diphosphomevalonate decarboxylase
MKVSATAPANIALVKYWGKRDKQLILPQNSSISMTLDGMKVHTTVEFSPEFKSDNVIINGKSPEGEGLKEVTDFLDTIRTLGGKTERAKIVSTSDFPTGAGLASSAAGLAALATAASRALGLELDTRELSIIARRGSGSASRSVEGGFVEWLKGSQEDGEDSYGKQLFPPEHWPEFKMVVAITSLAEKKIKSRAGMSQTLATCPYYKAWLETIEDDLRKIREGIERKDFTLVGKTAESNCLKMHALMMTTQPPIIYWNPATMRIIHSVLEWRDEGLETYFTIDAGPQVKIMCLEKDVERVKEKLNGLEGIERVVVCSPGEGAKLVEEHLF